MSQAFSITFNTKTMGSMSLDLNTEEFDPAAIARDAFNGLDASSRAQANSIVIDAKVDGQPVHRFFECKHTESGSNISEVVPAPC